MIVQMKVPEVGESIQEVEISQWLKQEGEWVGQDEDVVEVDSEKASLPIPAPSSGRITKILKRHGETAEVGEVIAEIDDAATPASEQPAKVPTATASEQPCIQQEVAVTNTPRVLEPRHPHDEPTAVATGTLSAAREEEIVPMSMIRRRIAARLVEAQHNSALLTTFNEIDMSAVLELRQSLQQTFQEQHGVKLGLMSFFVKSAIEALKRFPEVNAEIRGNDVVFRNFYDIGIAIGGGKGLVVPVLRDAEHLSFANVESAIDDFASRAASNTLRPEELTGGTFTISNGGIYGSLLSTPIVNPPQSGVLGMHAIQDRPVAHEGQVVIRPMMYVALSYDHRLIDGREAVGFLRHIKDLVEQPSRILLEV